MSWLAGYIGKQDHSLIDKLKSSLPSNHRVIQNEKYFLSVGGNPQTTIIAPEESWLVLGFGIKRSDNKLKWMDNSDWERSFKQNTFSNNEGHYLILRWDENQLIFISDCVGLRTVFFYKTSHGYLFATKIELLSNIISSFKLDFNEFGAKWLLHNKMSYNHFIYGISKLPPGSQATLTTDKFYIEKYSRKSKKENKKNLIESISEFLAIQIPEDYSISLGLSGGLDSRLLLAIFLNKGINFNLHTFGSDDDADVVIAREISDKLNLGINYLVSPENITEANIEELSKYLLANDLVEPISTYLKVKTFNDTYFNNKVIIDGALAEFGRRQLLNKLIYLGKRYLVKKDAKNIYRFIRSTKPIIFKEHIFEQLYKGALNEIENMFNELPDINEIGIENFADLLVYKYKIPNSIGPEQTRLDEMVAAFMPFGQKRIFEITQDIPVTEKTNSKIYYKAISDLFPKLEKFQLAKNGLIYPYKSSTIRAQLFRRIRNISEKKRVNQKVRMLYSLKDFISDNLTENKLKEFEAYDSSRILQIKNDFFAGKNELANDLEWIISFELYRRKMNLN